MKKIRALVMVLLATAALGFMGCPSHVSGSSGSSSSSDTRTYTVTGTVKVKIFNNADVPLTVSSITEYDYDLHGYAKTVGSYGQENSIPVNGNKEFEIPCSNQTSYNVYDERKEANKTEINCYYTSGSSVVYPYAGYINGTSVTIYPYGSAKQKTRGYRFSHPSLELKTSNPGTITVVYNFVKTTGGDYVLCKVE